MFPYINIVGHEFSSYALMAIIGMLVSFLVVLIRAYSKKIDVENQLYLIAFILISTILGAKFLYQAQHLPEFWIYQEQIFASLQSMLNYFGGGFVFYGGLIGGCAGAVLYARYFRVDAVMALQNFVIIIPLFHCFGRLGCFLAGCCYGIPYHGPLSITFTQAIGGPNGVELFPVQLVEAAINLMLFIFLLCMDGKFQKPLQNFAVYLLCYGIVRFLLEFLRGDPVRGVWIFSVSQWISLLVILPLGIYMMVCKPCKNLILKSLLYQP